MTQSGVFNPSNPIDKVGIHHTKHAYYNLSPEELVKQSLSSSLGELSDKGALCIHTGEFTGRSPDDKFIADNSASHDDVDWGKFNKAISQAQFDQLHAKVCAYLATKDVYVQDAYACADTTYRLNIRLIAEYPWSAQFAYNMFINPSTEELQTQLHDWLILCAPGFKADPNEDGTRQHNFTILDFNKKVVLIGGSAYTGEIKKSIFSVLNFVLPTQHQVFPMHCSANVGSNGETAIFFGLSGTGKTTLSADPNRALIGDDEHGWSDHGVFNFEGGCYAKCIDLTEEKEPDIFHAIKPGAILENIVFHPGTTSPDFSNKSVTENTRVSYPLTHIRNTVSPSKAGHPKHIFFLTCDAYGILPPISKLNKGQAMYHFISGYTAKVAGTEAGVTEPKATFSSCFGAPFLPLHPTRYAEMLGQKMEQHDVTIWLVNTGWSGGPYGVGHRTKLAYTRAMITAALEGDLKDVDYETHSIFGLSFPTSCPNVPNYILNPRSTWADANEYDLKANNLAGLFVKNFEKFKDKANSELLAASPIYKD